MRRIPLLLLVLFLLSSLPATASADDYAVVLLYHHVASDTPASTSVSPRAFKRHLDYLWDNNYFVLPLEEILDALANGKSLPKNAIAITFDDAYESVHSNAWPMLRERRWPFTVFVSTDYVDAGYGNYMSWSQIRELTEGGGTIGNHSLSHAHPLQRNQGESESAWLARFRDDLVGASNRIKEETDADTRLYAYPYGEFNRDVEEVVADLGLYGLGQQSGAIGPMTPLTSAPRFPISTSFADMDDFTLRVRSRPLPVRVAAPDDRLLEPASTAPQLELVLEDSVYSPESIGCFTSDGSRIDVTWQDRQRFRIQAQSPLPPGRSKYTCTAPWPGESGVFGWYSHLWIIPGGGD
jgi:peptidoglycan/xylan/chitin deacetylase (PgdA/CDA1 family)